MIAAEQGAGWLAECDDAGRFLAVTRELVDALADKLRQLAGDGPVLEICAGSGELARALIAAGVRVQATDAGLGAGRRTAPAPSIDGPYQVPPGSRVMQVLPMTAQAALHLFRPKVVLGAFVPFDACVDEAVLACPSVRHYVVLNARIGGLLGSSALWRQPGWKAEPLDAVRRWMLTRHDVWMGPAGQPDCSELNILQHGEAWHFSPSSSPV